MLAYLRTGLALLNGPARVLVLSLVINKNKPVSVVLCKYVVALQRPVQDEWPDLAKAAAKAACIKYFGR